MPSLSNNEKLSTDDLRSDAANWLRLQELYHLLEATPAAQQSAVLEAQTDDAALRARVLSLLATSTEPDAPAPAAYLPVAAGSRVGPYAIVRHLGSGGLGSVYLIERLIGGAIQPCALKLLAMRSTDASFHARFEREQQILATLQHPNITHLLDAGISDMGQPYLVMEFIDGVDLTRYCDETRLPLRQRLEIFLDICEAVTYAHSKLVVHLDLKPSNVMVTAGGKVKLLDFGTSKLIEADSAMTTTVLATPAYASPEQLRGEPVTTSCDLYSLGAILYELLTGHRPFQTDSAVTAMHRAATEEEPARLTTGVNREAAEKRGVPMERLKRMLRGDLSSIVARCLRSRPRDRYSSVEALVADVKRYLGGRPVLARRQTATYRMTKFLRRHRVALAVGSFVLLLLLTAGSYSYMRQQQALRQGERAERMQNFLESLLRLANTNYTGRPTTTIPEFLGLGVKVLPEFIHDPADRRAAQLSLAESIFDNSDFEHALPVLLSIVSDAKAAGDVPSEAEAEAFAGMAATELGQTELAESQASHALSLAGRKDISQAQRVWIKVFYVTARYNRGLRSDKDMALLQGAIDEARRRGGVPDRELGWAVENLADLNVSYGHLDDAEREAQEALALFRRQPYTLSDQADLITVLGDLNTSRGNDREALAQYRSAHELIVQLRGPDDLEGLEIDALVARAMIRLGQGKAALPVLEASLPVWHRLAPDNPQFAATLTYLAQAYSQNQQFVEAVDTAKQAVAMQEMEKKPPTSILAMSFVALAEALDGAHREQDALAAAEKAETIYAALPKVSQVAKSYQAANRTELRSLRQRSGGR